MSCLRAVCVGHRCRPLRGAGLTALAFRGGGGRAQNRGRDEGHPRSTSRPLLPWPHAGPSLVKPGPGLASCGTWSVMLLLCSPLLPRRGPATTLDVLTSGAGTTLQDGMSPFIVPKLDSNFKRKEITTQWFQHEARRLFLLPCPLPGPRAQPLPALAGALLVEPVSDAQRRPSVLSPGKPGTSLWTSVSPSCPRSLRKALHFG